MPHIIDQVLKQFGKTKVMMKILQNPQLYQTHHQETSTFSEALYLLEN
jgi:hypothetical protein